MVVEFLHADRPTDGWTDKHPKLTVHFRYFASAPKNTPRKIFETNSKEVTDENCVIGYVI